MTALTAALEARLLRYVQIATPSDEHSTAVPSTPEQLVLLEQLRDELTAFGAHDVRLLPAGFVLATIPATVADPGLPRIGFLAHVDTAPAYNGVGVKPLVHRNYDGTPITLPDNPRQVLSPADNPYLASRIGDDIVTASGTTLLGADDKAGVAIVMTLAEQLLAHADTPHGEIRVCFTTDEEIGTGIDHLDLDQLDVDFAYTLDGSTRGRLVYETFSADKAVVEITGVAAHPGTAYGKLVNALHLAAKIVERLPQDHRTPETTQGRDGFLHVYEMRGTAAAAQLSFIIRDFELDGLESHARLLRQVCDEVAAGEPRATIRCTVTPQYRNMRYWLDRDMRPVERAVIAMRRLGIEPVVDATRGGTDGSKLTERGVPTPNLFTGMQNIHGPLEWISLQDMAEAVRVCIELVREPASGTEDEGEQSRRDAS